MTFYATAPSPLGELLLVGDEAALHGVYLPDHRRGPTPDPGWMRADAPFRAAREQLEAYFAGALRAFDLPLAPAGTPFELAVWAALREIPFGATLSYGALAARLGRPGAARAVGRANGRNPLSIVVPCHRVIGGDGALTGYGGGLARKAWLLAHEAGAQLALL
jgi:methylated-DNA-[protein]-cysteine S-methyltransferase